MSDDKTKCTHCGKPIKKVYGEWRHEPVTPGAPWEAHCYA